MKFLFFKLEFPNFVANWQCKSYEKIQNVSSISLKLCLLGQKSTGTWGVNITINAGSGLKSRSQKCVGGVSHLNLANWTLDKKYQ